MKKRVDLLITIGLPDVHDAEKVSVSLDGSIKVLDKAGKEVTPVHVERGVHYKRTSKTPKYQTRLGVTGDYASVGGLDELTKFESFIVVDTNTVEIERTKVSAAFFVRIKLIAEGDGYRIISLDQRGHVYEFHNVPENPEMLAILKIAHDILKGNGLPKNSKIGIVTDSEMGAHAEISSQQREIYRQHNLPEGFSLIYASTDTGQELANKLMRFCDKESGKYLARLKQGSFRRSGLAVLEEEPSVQFRYTYYPSLEIRNSIVKGVSIEPETKYTVYFE